MTGEEKMTHHDEEKEGMAKGPNEKEGERCDDIDDPLRRKVCKMCEKPVLKDTPFCEEHAPPVP
jgi:hypothetical protein